MALFIPQENTELATINQKRFSNKIEFKFEKQHLLYKVKDSGGGRSFQVDYTQLSPEHYRVLLAYSERMASLAVRTADVQAISNGLIALSCTLNHAETNETTPVLSLLHRSAVISDEDKSISVMGYREGTDMDGFRYIRTW